MKIILLSGGSGKRLWPLSNDVRSKQFIKIFRDDNSYESMLQRVYRQIKKADSEALVTVATSRAQMSILHNQLGDNVDVCVEPCRRDTFPAIVLATEYLKTVKNTAMDETILVCPVDTYVANDYFETIINSVKNNDAILKDGLTLVGIKPTYPSQKYGYIIPEGNEDFCRVKKYAEKPSFEKAKEYIEEGALWSGGMFAFKLEYLLKKAHELIDYIDYDDLFSKYNSLEKISFDYAILEKEMDMNVIKYNGQWTDLGTWNTMSDAMESPIVGKAILSDSCENVHIINDMEVPILCMGLKNVVITTSPEGILVTDKEESAQIKPYVDRIKQQVRVAEKSWGEFRVMDASSDSLTVKVTLSAGKQMNYHSHQYRNEVWTIVSGEGRTIVDGMEQPVKAGDVITMEAGCKHTVIADTELQIIEVQLGTNISAQDKQKFELE